MPISNEEMRNSQIDNILSSSKEDLNKLSDTELWTIGDILRYRKQNKDIQLYLIRNLLDAVHFLIMQEEDKLRSKDKKTVIRSTIPKYFPKLKLVKDE